MPTSLHLVKHLQVVGTIRNRSNLRVGGSAPGLAIGDVDSPLIRDPVSGVPYIPGSSLKGKLRSLLEYKHGKVNVVRRGQEDVGQPCGCARADCPVCTLFGPHMRPSHDLGPTRLLIRDAFMTPESVQRLEPLTERGMQYAVIKTENSIERRTGRALNPRTQEVIPPGCEFDLRISIRVFDGDEQDNFKGWLSEALDLLPQDALGAGGSRGYGWVDVEYRFQDP